MRLLALAKSTLLLLLVAASVYAAQTAPATGHSFHIEGDHFVLDGKPFRVLSGEMHYARVPRAYWRDRLRKAKAMGLNAITTYVFWNVHEPQPGVYDFSGNNDVAEFIREAQQEGLYVILRPGPYSCAEWDLGGFPSWLLKDHSMVVRSTDPKFLAAASRWMHRLGQELAPLQIDRGGPIVMVQIENEYGSFGSDRSYLNSIRQTIVDSGFNGAQLYTADGADEMPNGSFPDLPAAVNFGTGDAKLSFAALLKMRPTQPHMAGEYWDGWFDHWGEKHAARDAQTQIDDFRWIVDQGYSVSMYMFHGGTSFGFMSGANWENGGYHPDVTSYDYQAALDESGRTTPKYMAFREILAKATGVTPPPIPPTPDPITITEIKLDASRSLWVALPESIHSAQPLSMEDIGQNYGYILYRTTLQSSGDGDLTLDQLHSYAQIYLDGALVGTLDRRLGKMSMPLRISHAGQRLDILVENSGRVNFSVTLRGEREGITKQVLWQGKPLEGWSIYSLPLNTSTNTSAPALDLDKLTFDGNASCAGPCFYSGHFQIAKPGATLSGLDHPLLDEPVRETQE